MGLDTRFLEPHDDGLAISTYNKEENKGILALWYVGRPRTINVADGLLSKPFLHRDELLALSDCGDHVLCTSGKYCVIRDALTGKARISGLDIDDAVSHKESLYFATSQITAHAIYRADDQGNLENNVEDTYLEAITALASHDERLFALRDIENEHTSLRAYRGTRPDGSLGLEHHYTSLAVSGDTILLGGLGMVAEHRYMRKTTPYTLIETIVFPDVREAYAGAITRHKNWLALGKRVYEEKKEGVGDFSLGDELTREMRDIATKYRCDAQALINTKGRLLAKEFAIEHMTQFHGQTLFAWRNNLYALGNPEPLHRFRNKITGLAVVPQEQLKTLKGMASVRRGVHKQQAFRAVA